MDKKSISVREMREILGIGKTDSYWLLKKKCFETITVFGKTRILIDSFEQWYANQFWYQKVDGTAPGTSHSAMTLSVLETADLLGITKASVYDILKRNDIAYRQIGRNRRIDRQSLMDWCKKTKRYQHIAENHEKELAHEEMLFGKRSDTDSVNTSASCL